MIYVDNSKSIKNHMDIKQHVIHVVPDAKAPAFEGC